MDRNQQGILWKQQFSVVGSTDLPLVASGAHHQYPLRFMTESKACAYMIRPRTQPGIIKLFPFIHNLYVYIE